MTGETKFESNSLGKRLHSMILVDFRRMFHSKLYYIMVCIAFLIPVLMLVMSTSSGSQETGIEAAEMVTQSGTMTNVWQAVESVRESEGSSGSDIMNMCNVNLLYYAVVIFVCLFVFEEFKSGYAKNLFAIRSKKTDYVISKTLSGFFAGTSMVIAYFAGAILGGTIAGLSFDGGIAGISGVIFCMLAKCFLMFLFVGISLLMSVVGKQKTWLSMLLSFAAVILLFSIISTLTPLDSTIINVFISLIVSGIIAVGLGAASNFVLQKISLV